MPLNPADTARRDRLVEAVQVLRDNKRTDLADEVDYVLSGLGAAFVQRLSTDTRGMKSTMSIKLDGALWDEIAPRLVDGKDESGKSLTEIVEDGFQAFLDGTFEVQLSGRQTRGTATTSRLTVSPASGLGAGVSARCRDLREQKTNAGRGLFVSTVAAHALYRHFQVGPYASDAGA